MRVLTASARPPGRLPIARPGTVAPREAKRHDTGGGHVGCTLAIDAMGMHAATSTLRLTTLATAVAAVACATACATRPAVAPRTRVETSETQVRAARELGAARVPEAAPHLESAQDHLSRALRLLDQGENEEAEGMLLRADADARLAASLAREASIRAEAEDAATRVHRDTGRR